MLSEQLQQDLQSRFAGAIVEVVERLGESTVCIDPPRIVDVCRFLKTERSFARLSSVTAVDWMPAASEPAAGSVRQKAPKISPVARRRR